MTARNSENFCNRLRRATIDQALATRIDRLARSMFELFAIVKKIIEAGDNFSTRETTLTIVRPLRLHLGDAIAKN